MSCSCVARRSVGAAVAVGFDSPLKDTNKLEKQLQECREHLHPRPGLRVFSADGSELDFSFNHISDYIS